MSSHNISPATPSHHTLKGISLEPDHDGVQVTIQEHSISSVHGTAVTGEPLINLRYHNLGTYDRPTAEMIADRLKQRFPLPGEPLTEDDIAALKQAIREGTL